MNILFPFSVLECAFSRVFFFSFSLFILKNNYFHILIKSLPARRRTRPGHPPSTVGDCLLPVLLLPMCSILVCLYPSPQCDARLFWVCLCFSSPLASIQGQQHNRCSLPSSGHVQSSTISSFSPSRLLALLLPFPVLPCFSHATAI